MKRPGRRAKSHQEWPTWAMVVGCYFIWISSVYWYEVLGLWFVLPATLMVTLHSSLQHEALHGHPTRSAALNELLVYPAVGLFVPYRSFRHTHLRHHNDANLTDPYDDPESWYLANADWQRAGSFKRWLLNANQSLAGRLIIGPAIALAGFWHNQWYWLVRGDRDVARNWMHHVLGMVPVLALLVYAGVPLWLYALCVAYPGMSLLMVRTFIEHRAAHATPERTAVVEAGLMMRLLFLNNNLHAVHHNHPGVAWYKLPALWRDEREKTLAGNAHYHYAGGYSQVARDWLFNRRDQVPHPFLRREGGELEPGEKLRSGKGNLGDASAGEGQVPSHSGVSSGHDGE